MKACHEAATDVQHVPCVKCPPYLPSLFVLLARALSWFTSRVACQEITQHHNVPSLSRGSFQFYKCAQQTAHMRCKSPVAVVLLRGLILFAAGHATVEKRLGELQKRERSARSKLSILRGLSHSKPPSDVHQIEQKAEVFTKQLEDVTSLLTTWDELTSLLSGLAQTSRKDRTFDGAKFQRGEPLDVVSLLQKYAEDLSAFADKVEGADFAPFADAIPVLELQLQLHKDTTDQLQTARAKLETMEANCKATIAECEKVLESRDLRPLPEIVINGHVCNFDPFPAILKPRPLASASNGDSDNSLDLTNTAANVTVIENVLIPTTTGTPGMDKDTSTATESISDSFVTASSDSLLFRNGKDCDVLTPPVLQDLYDSKESLPSDMDGDNL
ncbi:uncharacterized protein LOC135396697 isoform X4 [Ornithodoros turicata]|uniref:uncharacterized protein LOC135396697 isoform X4 n=1 Tax=Ornithodoros turicata TaxID=34597 RepID=UPI003139C1D0